MRHLLSLVLLSIASLAGSQAALAQVDDSDARKDRILANLQLVYPQLNSATVVMGTIAASGYGSLDTGSFSVNGELQNYLVAGDDTQLYMIAAPIDVSKDAAQIAAIVAERDARERAAAAARHNELLALSRGRPFKGNADAPVLIVEFADFECPFCARATATMAALLEKYPDDVKLVFMHMPLDFHPWALPAAIAAECAATQNADAFWTLHDSFFRNQSELSAENVMLAAESYLKGSRINMKQWAECATQPALDAHIAATAAVAASKEKGSEYGVSGTPGFFINGVALSGAQPIEAFAPLIEAAKQAAAGG